MSLEVLTVYLGLSAMLAMIILPLLLAFDDGVKFGLLKKILCRLGLHDMKKNKIPRYYCQRCRAPRNHPKLKVVDGGNKVRDNNYKH